MIQAPQVPEPESFDALARRPGKTWLTANPAPKRPAGLWIPFTSTLADAYGNLCGYAAMADFTGGTVDHFLGVKNHRHLAYEWRNYRFASATMNSSKGNADAAVLDPEQVQAGWFEILLPSLQLRSTERIPAALRERAAYTLRRLKLGNGERVLRWRRAWYALYEAGQLDLDGLREVAPLLADAVEREGLVKGKKSPRKRAR
jgi:hypothetical protein